MNTRIRGHSLALLFFLLLVTAIAWSQFTPRDTDSQIATATGTTLKFQDGKGTISNKFEVIVNGTAPATLTITLVGCMRGGTCSGTLATSSGTANQLLTPSATDIYDYYQMPVAWTGGNSTTYITINRTGTVARNAPSGGAGVGSFSGDGALLNNVASTGAVTATLANAGAFTVWGNNTGSSAQPSYVANNALSAGGLALATAGATAPAGTILTSACPSGVNPNVWVQNATPAYLPIAGIDTTDTTSGGPTAPFGTFVWCGRFWFNGTTVVPQRLKNTFVGIEHNFGENGLLTTNDDRSLTVSGELPTTDTGNHSNLFTVYVENNMRATAPGTITTNQPISGVRSSVGDFMGGAGNASIFAAYSAFSVRSTNTHNFASYNAYYGIAGDGGTSSTANYFGGNFAANCLTTTGSCAGIEAQFGTVSTSAVYNAAIHVEAGSSVANAYSVLSEGSSSTGYVNLLGPTMIGSATHATHQFDVTGTSGFTDQIISSLATGTPPFSIASTTNVPNLNASSLNGATFAAPGPIGSGTPSTGAFTNLSYTGTLTSPAINSVGVGGFFSGGWDFVAGSTTAQTFVSVANDLNLLRFKSPSTYTFNRSTIVVTTGIAAQTVTLCWYDATGTTLIRDSGTISAASSATTPVGSFASTTLQKDTYYLVGWSATSAAITTNGANVYNANSTDTIFNLSSVNLGKAANAVSAGACPSSTGAITAVDMTVPVFWNNLQ